MSYGSPHEHMDIYVVTFLLYIYLLVHEINIYLSIRFWPFFVKNMPISMFLFFLPIKTDSHIAALFLAVCWIQILKCR